MWADAGDIELDQSGLEARAAALRNGEARRGGAARWTWAAAPAPAEGHERGRGWRGRLSAAGSGVEAAQEVVSRYPPCKTKHPYTPNPNLKALALSKSAVLSIHVDILGVR